jgi:hypothetical protein
MDLIALHDGRPGVRALLQIETRDPAGSQPSTTNSQPTLDFIASTATLDRYHEVIEPAGWRLESYRRNPVFQNAHNYKWGQGRTFACYHSFPGPGDAEAIGYKPGAPPSAFQNAPRCPLIAGGPCPRKAEGEIKITITITIKKKQDAPRYPPRNHQATNKQPAEMALTIGCMCLATGRVACFNIWLADQEFHPPPKDLYRVIAFINLAAWKARRFCWEA